MSDGIGAGEQPPSSSTRGVFLSYASEDASAAGQIADALRAAGVEVWFDRSELRGGDLWDQSIRQQIRECRLFVPVISAHTDSRREGYFRREWKLAVERTHDMSERVAFLVPIVIDDTSEVHADVPERFRDVQWTRLPGGKTPLTFTTRIQRLLTGGPGSREVAPGVTTASPRKPESAPWQRALPVAVIGVALLALLAYLFTEKRWASSAAPATTSLAPGSERVLRHYGQFAVMMGHTEPGLAAARRAVSVDPLNFSAHGWLASALILARHYKEANVAIERAMQLAPNTDIPLAAFRGEVYYILGDYESARASCEIKPTDPESQYCLALVYAKLGRRPDAQRALQKRRATQGDADAYLYATLYAQWGDVPQALDWLDKAMGLRDSGLERVKTDALLDPIRNQARFQAIERELKFPE